MKDNKNSQDPTLVLNQYDSDGFLDFYYSDDLKQVIKILNKDREVKIMPNDKFIQLPDYGRLIIVSDLHGNLKDYKSYLDLWDKNDPDFHIVFTGDLIHAMDYEDGSIEILDDVIEKSKKYPNFHCLLGNHEEAHIINKDIFKNNENIRQDFENLVSFKKGYIEPSLTNYIKFFKTMPYFVKTANGLFISHAGPSKRIESVKDFESIFDEEFSSAILNDFLWNRFNEIRHRAILSRTDVYGVEDVDNFLDIIGSKLMVVGHTPINDGYKIFGRQMILSSSFYTEDKMYLDIDLSKKMDSMDDLIDCLKDFRGG